MALRVVSSELVKANMVNWCRGQTATSFSNKAPYKTKDMCARLYAFTSLFPSLRGDQLLALAQNEGTWEVTDDLAVFTPNDSRLFPDILEQLANIKEVP